MSVPVIRMSVEGMRHTIMAALTEYELSLTDEIRRAVEAYCTPENVQRVITSEVAAAINAAVHEEVGRYYRQGLGREAVRRAVEEAPSR